MPHTIGRIRGEFIEMPGLRLTTPQAVRLFGVDHARCQTVLDQLVTAGFLRQGADGAYARAVDGAIRPRPAKAALAQPERRVIERA